MQAPQSPQFSSTINIVLNGENIRINDVEPTQSVLTWLRERQLLMGTKEGCAEGDCGACTVVLGELIDGQLSLKSVNACILFIAAIDRKALFTVEYLKKQSKELHPAQQAMVQSHGSQCGFCTPGFIMSLWAIYHQHQEAGTQADRTQIRTALTGNLCRCTGYHPILEAGEAMFSSPDTPLNRQAIEEKLQKIQSEDSLSYDYLGYEFIAPNSLDHLLAVKSEFPESIILSGGTDVGLWVNKQLRELKQLISLSHVSALKTIVRSETELTIGSAVSLTDAFNALCEWYPELITTRDRFASMPIRNSGTLGGNIANGSPIGDSMPALIVLGASITLNSIRGVREIELEDFYLDYMKKDLAADEVVTFITIPRPKPGQQIRCYKLSKRHDSDISAVFAAFSLELNDSMVSKIRIAYGGMAAIPKRAEKTELVLLNNNWNAKTIETAMKEILQDYSPLSDMRASDTYRMRTAMNCLQRFFFETDPENPLPPKQVSVFDYTSGESHD